MDKQVAGSASAPRLVRSWLAQQGPWLFVGVAAGCFLALGLAVVIDGKPYFPWDLAVSRAVQSDLGPGLVAPMRGLSLPGDELLWSSSLVVLACLAVLALGRRREAMALLAVVLVGQVLKIAIKHLVNRPRPSDALVQVLTDAHEHQSFPSGHTVHYTVFFGFLCYLSLTLAKPRALRWPLFAIFGAFVLFIGLARIYLGAHWVTDVIGGYLLGGAVLAAGIGVCRRHAENGRAEGKVG
jgi:undecaprenyl-diphosphatase